MEGASTDILVLPFFGQGHLFPCAELCKRLSSPNRKSILIIPSHLSSSIPSDLHRHPSVHVFQIPPLPLDTASDSLGPGIESFLSAAYHNARPAFVVVDVLMSWTKPVFKKFDIPIVSFFTSGACATIMEYAASKAEADATGPGPARTLPGLPDSIAMSDMDVKRRDRRRKDRAGGRPGGPSLGPNMGPARSGPLGRWMDQTEGSVALITNTCDDLEAPFLEYLSGQAGKPVFGVGPLLSDSFWRSIGSVVRDGDSRPGRETNYTEDEVIQWLDSKPRGSVIYVSFGSEVGPSVAEYDELAEALAETDKSFIWVIQPGAGKPGPPANMFGGKAASARDSDEEEGGYEPRGLEERVGDRGLIIKGWAPQLSILSHPSTGGFLSHCGWNSTVEAICCGVPILGWPIRGDQFYDANLVAKYLNVGAKVEISDEESVMVKKNDVIRGIKAVMDDGEVRERAMALRGIFKDGYPSTSAASLEALIQLATKN